MVKSCMTLSRFITDNMDAIVAEWLSFAMTMEPAASTMSTLALRDHAKPILQAIARDIDSDQTPLAQADKSKGLAPRLSVRETAAATHGALRQVSGFDMNQLGAEYRALRASVIRLWMKQDAAQMDSAVIDDIIRFNEAVDQAVAESTARYAAELALSRDTFMAILAHDLRSPLSAIAMLSHMLEKSAATDSVRQQAGQIQRSTREMGAMIRDLLEYTRTHLGKGIPVAPTACSISRICSQALEELRSAHPERAFVLEVPADLAGHVDDSRLRQALSNLLNNAVQNAVSGSPVTLSASVQDGMIVLAVKNLGTPIPPESLQVIFDPLVQLSSRSSIRVEATSTNLGLGLFIAREVALGHGGTIDVTSSAVDGTVFTIRLPAG